MDSSGAPGLGNPAREPRWHFSINVLLYNIKDGHLKATLLLHTSLSRNQDSQYILVFADFKSLIVGSVDSDAGFNIHVFTLIARLSHIPR
jgi:hypothetical protein